MASDRQLRHKVQRSIVYCLNAPHHLRNKRCIITGLSGPTDTHRPPLRVGDCINSTQPQANALGARETDAQSPTETTRESKCRLPKQDNKYVKQIHQLSNPLTSSARSTDANYFPQPLVLLAADTNYPRAGLMTGTAGSNSGVKVNLDQSSCYFDLR